MQYETSGTCSKLIDFEVEDNIITSVAFTGGCNGNLKGISALVAGMTVDDAISKLKGIKCGYKNTSCPDQLACALEQYKANTAN
ncbi:MAG: TIGR03905 family TSCPD domain-containing protein [Lachnospiraceae bacterium]|nr:TIGR03905 family TSCPD domain-containing protein [Lachnospiraceae bacterium]MDE7271833.1 TIGR03905 family TSCPD domain-containing protein [Lachnospiraceae bacterium]